MNDKSGVVTLGDVLQQSDERIDISPEESYQQITVRMWGNGVVLRGTVDGSELGSQRWYVARAAQFILSKIDARHGAFGLVPPQLDGAIVSGDFPLFFVRNDLLLPEYLNWLSRTRDFIELCKQASEGTTNRIRLRIDRLLSMEIPLPPLEEQRRIVAHIDALAARISEARGLRQAALEEVETAFIDISDTVFSGLYRDHTIVRMGETFTFRNDLIRPADGATGELVFVGLQHVESHTGRKLGEDYLLAEELKGRKFKFSPGEIVYGYLRPYLNKVWIADCDGFCSVDQYVLQPDTDLVTAEYLAHYMRSRSFLHTAIELTHNLQLPRLRSGLLQSITMPLPAITQQRDIVTELDDLQHRVYRLRNLQSESAAEMDALLPSVLDQAFRGELI